MLHTIWISTAPRTGSMWLFNVTREILRISGKKVVPDEVPQSDKKMLEYASQFVAVPQASDRICVLKLHNILQAELDGVKILTIHRDLRDVMASLKEFMKCDFENVMGYANAIVKFTDIYENYNKDYLKMLAYHDVERQPENVIQEIAEFLGIDISKKSAKNIAKKYSRENVRRIINKSDRLLSQKIATHQAVDQRDIIYFSEKNYRAIDRETGFQTGHISERKSGDWEKIFNKTEIQRIHAQFGSWLSKYGYL